MKALCRQGKRQPDELTYQRERQFWRGSPFVIASIKRQLQCCDVQPKLWLQQVVTLLQPSDFCLRRATCDVRPCNACDVRRATSDFLVASGRYIAATFFTVPSKKSAANSIVLHGFHLFKYNIFKNTVILQHFVRRPVRNSKKVARVSATCDVRSV